MLRLILILLLDLTMAIPAEAQSGQRNVRQEITWLKNALMQQHVEPKPIDDVFSRDLFDKVLDDLDPDRVFFTQADIAWLDPYRNLLDDDVKGKDTGFFNRLKERYRSGLERSQNSIHSVLGSAVDWKKAELYDPDADWAKDEQTLSDRHRKWLKYQILKRLTDLLDRDSVPGDDFFEKNLADATDYVLITTLRPIKRMLKDPVVYHDELATVFMQAMAHSFDPHSDFFSADDFEDFMGAISTEDYYFGFTLGEDGKGNIIITALAPGGAAWKSGALRVSDIVVALQWLGDERIDLAGMNIDDVNLILSAQDDDLIEMTVRTVEGNEQQVVLRKEKLEAEQNVVQSFILNGITKTGYIYLPDFYTRWDDEQQGGRCASDVAKEIIKLKREGIEGLILDLRFNGGGSLYEAGAMAGIFIDEGPLVVVSTRDQKGVTLKDMNRGTIYDGPLVIMVNGASASASEVLAATIQDYNRGLIVGSTTYGKATGQNIFPLRYAVALKSLKKHAGGEAYVKITTQRLYRVTGKSTQARGVIPDVVLPDIFGALGLHESKDRFALKQDSIIKNTYYKPMKPLNRKLFQQRSRERVSKHPVFQELQQTINWLEEGALDNGGVRSLSWEEYLGSAIEQKNKQIQTKRNVVSPEVIYEVTNSLTKEERLTLDDYARSINDRWLGILATDIYLQETYHILTDYIHDTKKL